MIKRVTIKDIAMAVGVSTATVSRVLGDIDDPYISDATKEKVKSVAISMGYKKNILANALATGKTNIIEIQLPAFQFFYADVASMFMDILIKDGYQTTFRDIEALYDRRISFHINDFVKDGIISIARGCILEELLPEPKESNLVSIGHVSSKKFDHVSLDFYNGTKCAIEHFIKTGCRKIAYLTNSEMIKEEEDRCKAYLDVMNETGFEPIFINTNVFTMDDVYNGILEHLNNGLKIDALFCHSDFRAVPALKAITGRRDLASVGFDINKFDGETSFSDREIIEMTKGLMLKGVRNYLLSK